MAKRIVLMVIVFTLFIASAWGQESDEPEFDLGRFIRQNNIHKIGGYTSMGLTVATGVAGLVGWEGHPFLGYSALGSSVISSVAGIIAYNDRLDVVWPHVAFNGIAITAMALNAFVLEPGSLEHRISGITATAAYAGSLISIFAINS